MADGIITILDETDKISIEEQIANHTSATDNPHGVTAAQVGALSKTGDTLTGILTIQKCDNGSSSINKNHSSTEDYGTQIRDVSASDQVATLAVCGAEQKVTLTLRDGPDDSATTYDVYHTGNKPTASDIQPGAFSGKMLAQYTASSDVTAGQLRNIYAGTTPMTSGSTKLNSGYIYLQYK